jgi:hypothetical protein
MGNLFVKQYEPGGLWNARSGNSQEEADTPEDACAKLAIKLIKQKVITP